MTIHIYGDSFGAEFDNENTWPIELSKLKNEEIRVLAKGGTGPNWSFKKLINDLDKTEKIDEVIKDYDTVIFLLSCQKRLEFPFLKKEWHSGGAFREAEDDNWVHPFTPEKSSEKDLKIMVDQTYIKEYRKELKVLAQSLGPMFLYENVKNISFLHLISKNFKKIRFVVFTCFSLDNYIASYKNFDITSIYTKFLKELKFDSLDDANFDYIKIPIGHMVGPHKDMTIDHLDNHMSVSQNLKFAKFVYDIIMYKEPDKSWFADEPYDDVFEKDRLMEPLFIYE